MAYYNQNQGKYKTAQQSDSADRWTDVHGMCKVYNRKDKNGNVRFFTRLTKKVGERSQDWDCYFVDVQFKKGLSIQYQEGEPMELYIDNGFLTFDRYTNREGQTITTMKLVIMSVR